MKLNKILIIITLLILLIGTTFAFSSKEIESANYLAKKGIIKKQTTISGYKLDNTITRKEAIKIIAKLSGKEIEDKCTGIFLDVDKNDWACKYIEFAYRENLIAKKDNFKPSNLITKSESLKLILKSRGIEKSKITSDWEKDYMTTALEKGIIEEEYFDFTTKALRGWIFKVSTLVIKKEEEKKTQKEEDKLISDEAL